VLEELLRAKPTLTAHCVISYVVAVRFSDPGTSLMSHRGTDPARILDGEGDPHDAWNPPYILRPSRALKLAWLAGRRLRRNLRFSGFADLLDALIGRLITSFAAGLRDEPDPEEWELDP
jgi:hypothetical protein